MGLLWSREDGGGSEMVDKELVLVLGMPRSGTSALTRILSLCGCSLPESLLFDPDRGGTTNPTGFWEPLDALKLNRGFLIRHDAPFGDPTMRLQEEVAINAREREEFVEKIRAFLNGCARGAPLVIKEPSLTDVAEYWIEAAIRDEFALKFIIIFRHPGEVLASLAAMPSPSGSPPPIELVSAFWLKENLLAERHSRKFPRVFVNHLNLLREWRLEIARVAQAIAIDVAIDEAAVSDFLTDGLYRQRHLGPLTEVFSQRWLARVFAIFSLASRSGPIDTAALDEVYDAYRANERAFRIALSSFGNAFAWSTAAAPGQDERASLPKDVPSPLTAPIS